MNLTYGPDGETLERAVLSGEAVIQLAGDAGKPGRRIAGDYIDVAFAIDRRGDRRSRRATSVELKIPGDERRAGPGHPRGLDGRHRAKPGRA